MTTGPDTAVQASGLLAPEPGRRVVVGDDGTPTARRALGWAEWLRERLDGRLSVVTVAPSAGPEAAATLLTDADEAAVLVVADRARRAPGAKLGPTAAGCVARARGAVLVVHPGDAPPPTTGRAEILVGVDGSPASARALDWVDRLTRGDDDVDCVTVIGSPEWVYLPGHRTLDGEVAASLDRAVHAVIGDRHVRLHTVVEHGDAVAALTRTGRSACLVVVGTHRHHPDDGSADSVGVRCAAAADVPVLVVH